MSQQNFDQKTPTVRVNDGQSIPAAIVHAQTRDGKDEAIMGAGLMLRDGGPGTDFTEVSDTNPLPVKATLTGSDEDVGYIGRRKWARIIADAEAITSTDIMTYQISGGGIERSQVERASAISFSVMDTHNAPGRLTIYPRGIMNLHPPVTEVVYFEDAQFFSPGTNRALITPYEGGDGARGLIVVPALRAPNTDISIQVNFDTAPTAGVLSIAVLLH